MFRLNKIILIIFTIFTIINNAFSQSSNFEYLLFPYTTSSSSMGNSTIAIKGNANYSLNNPASLYEIESKSFSTSYTRFLVGINSYYASYAMPYKFAFTEHMGYAAFHIINMDYGSIEGIDKFANKIGKNYSANDFAAIFTWASFLEKNWSYGVNLKLAHSSIAEYSSIGMFFDFGIIYTAPLFYKTNFGFNISNAGFFVKNYTKTKQTSPLSFDIGFSKELKHLPLTFCFTYFRINKGNNSNYIGVLDRWKIGMEFKVHPAVALKAGLNRTVQKSLKIGEKAGFAGTTLGLSLYQKKYKIDLAYWNWGDIGNPIQFGFNYFF